MPQVVQLEGDKAALVKHVGQLEECCAQLTDQLRDVKGKWASSCKSSVKLHREMLELRRLTGQQAAPGGELWSVPQYSTGSLGQAKHDLAGQVRSAQCGVPERGLVRVKYHRFKAGAAEPGTQSGDLQMRRAEQAWGLEGSHHTASCSGCQSCAGCSGCKNPWVLVGTWGASGTA